MTKLTLRAAQLISGKTQNELAGYMGVSRISICNWIKDYKRLPVEKLLKICEFLGCNINDLDL